MAREREIKIQLKGLNLDQFIDRIDHNGFKLIKTVSQEDIYFDTRDWLLYGNLAALRIRLTDGIDGAFSFKKLFFLPSRKDQYYIEEIETNFPLQNHALIAQILGRIGLDSPLGEFIDSHHLTEFLRSKGFFDDQHMSKTRQVYRKGKDEIVVDDVSEVGTIIEIESETGEPLEIVADLLKEEEWERNIEGTSYAWLRKVKGLTSHMENLQRFKTKPDWNVWENERSEYEKLSD